MADFSGKIGTNFRYVNQDVQVSAPVKQSFATREEALQAAKQRNGSELVYEKAGQWHLAPVGEKGWTPLDKNTSYPLKQADRDEIQLDANQLAKRGISQPQISFLEEDNSYVRLQGLLQTAQNPDMQVRMDLASQPGLPSEVYQKLAQSRDLPVRAALARNATVPAQVLTEMAKDRMSLKALALAPEARNRPEVQSLLQKTGWGDVKRLMRVQGSELDAARVRFQQHLDRWQQDAPLRNMVQDPMTKVREQAARRPDFPEEYALELAHDPMTSVRTQLARGPAFPARKAPPAGQTTIIQNIQIQQHTTIYQRD